MPSDFMSLKSLFLLLGHFQEIRNPLLMSRSLFISLACDIETLFSRPLNMPLYSPLIERVLPKHRDLFTSVRPN